MQATAQSLEAFLAQFNRRKAEDTRTYRIHHLDGSYFKKWDGTPWETVKRFALWTPNQQEAATLTFSEWDKSGYMDLVTGFGGSVKLERVT